MAFLITGLTDLDNMHAKTHAASCPRSLARFDLAVDARRSLQEKLDASITAMNKPVDIYSAILRSVQSHILPLNLPETLLYDGPQPAVLFTDSTGIVRIHKGDLVRHSFLTMVSEHIKQLRNFNPLGVHFPKFLSFQQGKAQFTIHHKADFSLYYPTMSPSNRVQRFIWPKDFTVQKYIIVWKRTKKSKIYSLTLRGNSRPGGKKPSRITNIEELSLDSGYVACTHFLKNYDVSKEKVTEEMESHLETLRKIVNGYCMQPEERPEELLVYMCKSQDGKLYFLDLPLAKVSIHANSPAVRRRSFSSNRIPQLMQQLSNSERVNSKFLPYLSLADMSEQSEQLYQMHLHMSMQRGDLQGHVKTGAEEQASRCLDSITSHYDSLLIESRELKKEFGIAMKVQLRNYPPNLLDNVISQVYECIIRDPRLSKYYLDKTRIYSKLVHAVKAVFLCGLSRNIKAKMRVTHMGMGITDQDFDQYIKYFLGAMEALEVREEDVEQTKVFLESFRGDVVQRLLELPQS